MDSRSVSAGAVREQLERILVSRRFVSSPQLSRLLRFIVEETLRGNIAPLKESVLGIEVLGRGPDFDPRLDPIVRVQAGKLRSRLRDYYETEGRTSAIVLELPKGRYVPTFRQRATVPPEPVECRPPVRRISTAWLAVLLTAAATSAAWWWTSPRSRTSASASVRQITFDTGSTTFPAISPDGKLLAYASDRAGKGDLDIWIQEIGSGEPVALTTHHAADLTPDISPDARRVAFRSHRHGGGIYIASVLGTGERKLASGGWRPRFSPDGTSIVYQGISHRAGGDLFIISPEGGSPRMVAIGNDVQSPSMPLWTPDGKYLLFAARERDQPDWWIVRAGGGMPVRIGLRQSLERSGLSSKALIEPGGWHGNSVVFALQRGSMRNLWKIRFSPGDWKIVEPPIQITFGSGVEGSPRTSPAGRIAFTSEVLRTNLWALHGDTNSPSFSAAPVQLTADSSLIPGNSWHVPRFSLSGNLLAYTSLRSGTPAVWLSHVNTGAAAVLAAAGGEDHPLLSHDGSRVACSFEQGGRHGLRVADIRTPVFKEICQDCGEPVSWTHDDRGIYCISVDRHTVLVIDASSGGSTPVVHDARLRFRHAAPSPDGRWLAVTADGHSTTSYAIEDAGRKRLSLANVISADPSIESVHWAANGEFIYFFSTRDDFRCLMAQRTDRKTGKPSGEAFYVRHFHETRAPWSTWISVTSDRLVFRLTDVLSNIYSTDVAE